MTTPRFAIRLEAGNPVMEDRAVAFEAGLGLVLAVADGAGGISGGDRAADRVVEGIEALIRRDGSPDREESWEECLAGLDRSIARDPEAGESTAVVLAWTRRGIVGASVGDSEAWLIGPDSWLDLTAGQRRKPLLGSGRSTPLGFRHDCLRGVIVVGSDGLFKYARPDAIRRLAIEADPDRACSAMFDLARMPNGRLRDDIAVIVASSPSPA